MTGIPDTAHDAYQALTAAEATLATEQGKLAEQFRQRARDDAEREKLRRIMDAADATRLLDGEDAVSRNPREEGKLAKLDRNAGAREAAIRQQELRVQAAASALAQVRTPFRASVLELVANDQAAAIEAIRAALSEHVAPLLAQLAAADQTRNAIVGTQFTVPAGIAAPFGGVHAMRTFVKAIPPKLRPAELAEEALLRAAHAISIKTISEIKEGTAR